MHEIRRPTRGQAASLLGGLLVVMLIVAGCGTTSTGTGAAATPTDTPVPAATNTPAPTPTTNPNTVMIGGSIGNFKFIPASLTVKVGSTVTWVNDTSIPHTSTSDAGSAQQWDSGFLTVNGGTFSFTFTKAGTFTYHCTVHSYMHGTIIVTP